MEEPVGGRGHEREGNEKKKKVLRSDQRWQ